MNTIRAIYPPIVVGLCFLLLSPVSLWAWLGVALMAFDTKARLSEYRLLSSNYKYKHRYAVGMRRSWCGRTAATAALPEMKFVYYKMGYRWYHVLPDGFPLVFSKRAFWCSFFGIINKR